MGYMNTVKTYNVLCAKLEDTLLLGEELGRRCKGGEVFELISDLGGGKTALVRGLATGLESVDDVSSPSFTLNNTYRGRLVLEHFDFYRLNEAGVVADELREALSYPDTVVAVEWGDIVHDVQPADRVVIRIATHEDDSREYLYTFPESFGYLFEGIS
jgi:tRNA threonylcarbamoyladenosine biosynthesis protein TsaE